MFHRGVPRAVRRELEYEVVGKPKPAPKPEQPTGSLGGAPMKTAWLLRES